MGLARRLLAGALVRLFYISIQVNYEVANSYVPFVVIVFEVGRSWVCRLRRGPGVSHPRSVATVHRAVSHWGRHGAEGARAQSTPGPESPVTAVRHNILSFHPSVDMRRHCRSPPPPPLYLEKNTFNFNTNSSYFIFSLHARIFHCSFESSPSPRFFIGLL